MPRANATRRSSLRRLALTDATFAETDVRSLCVFARDDAAAIIGGLTGRTYWRYLDIAFLWVDEKCRGRGLATQLMCAAESEARNRGCQHVFLDTLSFQALAFYQKLGYTEFGRLSGFSGKHDRYCLASRLASIPSAARVTPSALFAVSPQVPSHSIAGQDERCLCRYDKNTLQDSLMPCLAFIWLLPSPLQLSHSFEQFIDHWESTHCRLIGCADLR